MKLEQRINPLRPDRTLANSFVMVCAVWVNLLVVVVQPVYASDQLGDIAIDGAAVPSALFEHFRRCLLYTSPSPRDGLLSRMPSSA